MTMSPVLSLNEMYEEPYPGSNRAMATLEMGEKYRVMAEGMGGAAETKSLASSSEQERRCCL